MNEGQTKPKPKRYSYTNAKARTVFLTEAELTILSAIGKGNKSEGLRQALTWAAHFYQLGLTDDMDLNCIGLVTVSTTDQHPYE
jgi:hypothetical protein